MWWSRRKRQTYTINTVIQMPPEKNEENKGTKNENIQAPSVQKKKKIIKILTLTLWVPITAIFFLIFWICFRNHVLTITKEAAGILLNSSFILLGFSTATRYSVIRFRASKDLENLRLSSYWIAHEFLLMMDTSILSSSIISGLINLFHPEPNMILSSVQISLILTVLIYSLASFICTNKFGLYT